MAPALPAPSDRLITLPPGEPELTLGWEAVHWASKYLTQPNGRNAGQRFRFSLSQVRFLLWWYALDDAGRFIFRRAARRLAKGSGKSPMAALMALVELCAPVRLKDFDAKRPGGCVGKPVSLPLVQIAATAEAQTENTMRMVRAFAPKGSRVVLEHGLDPGQTIYHKADGGKLQVITSSSNAAEGAEASFIVADETEHWVPGNGGPTLAATLADNLAKSGSRMLETSNAWQPGRESVAEETYAAWLAQEAGRTRGKTRILYDARIAPPDTQLSDEKSLMAALELVYGDCWWQTDHLPAIVERIHDPQSKPDDSKRKYLNWPTAADDAWCDEPQEWLRLSRPDVKVEHGEEITLFFDGSLSRDATALVGCRMSDGHVFTLGVWYPAHERQIDVPAVESTVARVFEDYDVVGFFADVREWESQTKVTWPDAYGDRLIVKAAPSARQPQTIAWDMRSRRREFGDACETARGEISTAAFTHDGNEDLTRHVLNARQAFRDGRIGVAKESPDSPNKIDAAVCMIGARMVRRIVLASPEWEKRQRRKHAGKRRVLVLR